MSILINCRAIGKRYGSRTLFADVTFGVFAGDKLGVVGKNGSGKSTLLRILAGEEEPDTGEVTKRALLRAAYVSQKESFTGDASVLQTALSEINNGGDPFESSAEMMRILGKVGFSDVEQPLRELSGGWRKRLALAIGLYGRPDVLLLDEPTNHLDLDTILWLEDFLSQADFTWVMVSHDRTFLERTTTKVAELDKLYEGGLLLVDGRYSDFVERRVAYHQNQIAHAQSLTSKMRRETEWLRRGPKARTTKAKSRIDAAYELQDELGDVKQRLVQKNLNISFSETGRQTKKLIEADALSFSFGEAHQIVDKLSLILAPGTRLGILGSNGSGKTTLMRLLLKELPPTTGQVRHADNLEIAYFDQARDHLDPSVTLARALSPHGDSIVYRDSSVHVATWAKRFLFDPEQLSVPVGQLSGGEQARILIARFMAQKADVLFLDEPTNDLDIATIEILEESLSEFPGTVVLVSHDRFLLENVCNVFVGVGSKFPTNPVAHPEQWYEITESRTNGGQKDLTPTISTRGRDRGKRLSYMEQRELDGMEAGILQAELDLQKAQAQLDDPHNATSAGKLTELAQAVELAQGRLDALFARWAELEDKQDQS